MPTKAPTKGQLRRDKVLLALREKPGSTAAQIDEKQGFLYDLEQERYVRKGEPRKEGRGRPTSTYKLAPKGSKRASALAKRS